MAIKQLDKHGFQDNKAFLTGVAMLSQLHHENLVDIVGYCADGDQRLLVYESVPAGTLEDHLFGTRLADVLLVDCYLRRTRPACTVLRLFCLLVAAAARQQICRTARSPWTGARG